MYLKIKEKEEVQQVEAIRELIRIKYNKKLIIIKSI